VRRQRLAGAFAVPAPARVRGRRVLVVDDVMTSGSTLAECARTLLEAGAAEVLAGALARATVD
jgi:predicted amidophosphoribosyltransferase